jgi:outer membrane protein OmpA-like peptidoglycan-associated protein
MTIMLDARERKNKRLKRLSKILMIVGGVFLLFVIVGFWVVPPLLKPKLEAQLSDLLGREVTIGAIKLNPLVLSATISNLTVPEADGQPFAGFEELYANAQLSSIINWAFTIGEIRVQDPFGVLKLLPGNKLNIDDILAKLGEPKPDSKEKAGLPRAIIEKFQVIDGKAVVENLSEKEPIREEFAPISFTLENLSTLPGRQGEYRFVGVGPMGGQFEVNGKIAVNPVRVQGSYEIAGTRISHYWEHIKDFVSFQIISGTMGVSGDYAVEIVDGQLNARLENGAFELEDFRLAEKGKKEVLIALPTFAMEGIGADLQAREINVESIQTANARIRSWLAADGSFTPQNLFLADLEKLMEKKAADQPDTQTPTAQPWHLNLKKMAVKDWSLVFEDRTLAHPAEILIDDIDVVVGNLSNQKDARATVEVAMQINRAGEVRANGTAAIDPLQADLKVVAEKIALNPFQPYVDEAVKAQIAAGTISSTGRIRYRGRDAQPQIQFEGDFSVDALELQDRVQKENFFTLAHFKAGGIALELLPNKLHTSRVLIERAAARVTIDQNGMVNVVNTFTPVQPKDADRKDNLLKRLVNFLILQFKGPMPMDIERVQLAGFRGDFVDASISPAYSTQVQITEGIVKGLSSEPSAMADFKINGSIDQTAAIEGSGQMNPMNALTYSKVDFSLKDFELKPVSPYSGKFVGFKIDRGRLHTELKYQVNQDMVDGNNIIYIDELALGEKVDSPDAPALPIKLGVAMLKDDDDRITLQLPVKGNVRDPRFDFGKAIETALTGTIEGAGNAPFAAITEIDGIKGEELRTVVFDFGSAVLQEREILKLNALANFMKEKNALLLGIVGTADRRMDGAALLAELPDERPSDGDHAVGKEPGEKPSADKFVDDQRLEGLARQRAEAVSAYLTEKAHLEAKRIQIKPFKINPAPDGEGGLVEFSLSVE